MNYDIFEPTLEWKEIKPNQAIPRGLHVRINMQTGRKEAKIYTPPKQVENTDRDETQTTDEENRFEHIKEALKNIKNDFIEDPAQDIKDKFRSIEEIRKEFEAANTKV